MHLFRDLRRVAAACLTAAALAPAAAVAQSTPGAAAAWRPERPITLVVPYSPGGGTDVMARLVAKELTRRWNSPVNVENTPGADGLIGTRRVIESRPDGYTYLVQLPSLLLNRHLPGFKGADPAMQLMPVSAYSILSGIYVVNAAIPGATLPEVLRHCRTAPQPCTFGTTENTARLRLQMLQKTELPSMIVVNYKGGGQLITDLLGNNVNVASMGYTAVLPHMKSGQLRVVMSSGKERSPVLPDVQSATDAGFPQLIGETWYGLFAPLGTPKPIVDAMSAAVREAIKDEAVLKGFAVLGASPIGNTPEQFAQLIREEAERLETLVRQFPIQ
ncbi:MAG TPA: tripartite tricarboxylate transporter substrate binding protein [Burkholderiaceae bacterium]|nr:tripartite tricarboxylate transporter substrate binding protein [Burkholderiaceae bacterium]